jgi:BlaI family penicillinase repressor
MEIFDFFVDMSYICRISYSYDCKRRSNMTRKKLPAMSPAETEILRLVWQLRNATVLQIRDNLPAKRKIAYKTVQTLLRRLENKGYLKHRLEGKAHVFYPAIKQDRVVRRTVLEFLDRLFGGDPKPLMQFLAKDGHIDTRDLERLKKLIDKS